jgi:hypothetical protein
VRSEERAAPERPTREERHRQRTRRIIEEMRRSYITMLKEFDRYLAQEEADDVGGTAILPGHSQDIPLSRNRPPRM